MFRSEDARLDCTLLAQWEQGYEEGWFVLSDLPPEQASVAWYTLRGWVERGFKHTKSGGWNWQETRTSDPQRASRQWLAMAVACVLLVRQGVTPLTQHATPDAERTQRVPAQTPPEAQGSPPAAAPVATPAKTARRRVLSVFRKGLLIVQSALLANLTLPHGRFVPEPWPQTTVDVSSNTPAARPP